MKNRILLIPTVISNEGLDKDIYFEQGYNLLIDLDKYTFYEKTCDGSVVCGGRENMPDRDYVMRGYLDLIASLHERYSKKDWWASSLSEKNSFHSKLFTRMYQLEYVGNILGKISAKDVVIVGSDETLLSQIRTNYKDTFVIHGEIKYSGAIQRLIREFKGAVKLVVNVFKELRDLNCSKSLLKSKIGIIPKDKKYTVIRTWVDQRNYLTENYNDSYFGKLIDFVSCQGKEVIIFAGILKDFSGNLKKFKDETGFRIIPYNSFLKKRDVFKSFFRTCFNRPKMHCNIKYNGSEITELAKWELWQDIESQSFFYAILQYYCCRRLSENIQIENFIYTYENYAWEKMSILGLRAIDNNITITGFQHAFIAKNSFQYFPGRGEEHIMPMPDKIVTLGNRTKEIMMNKGSYEERIFSTGCALRQDYLFGLKGMKMDGTKDIFVPMSILLEDAVKVIKFLFSAGMEKYEGKIYLRFHPRLSVEKVSERLGFDLPKNFIISENPPISEEIRRAGVILYTWTTVCLEALKMGRPVIYLDVNYPLDVDPLFECDNLKDKCSDPELLIDKIERLAGLDEKTYKNEYDKALEYLDEYFIPVTENNMAVFINGKGKL